MSEENGKTVIVVGAGVSGLRAAQILHEVGFAVTVLEARERIGGRVWSDRRIDGASLDLGASWIHGIRHNPIYKLARKHDISLLEWDYDNGILYDTKGASSEILSERIEALYNILADVFAQPRFSKLSVDNVVEVALSEGRLAEYSEAEINYVVSAYIVGEYAGSSKDLSVAAHEEGSEFPGPDAIFPQGYDQLIPILAQNLHILTNHVVTEIDYTAEKPVVFANGRSFTADFVLVTVPLGVLQNNAIRFIPDLPSNKMHAIHALGMGTLNKVYLQFPRVFWNEDIPNIEYISEQKGQFNYWLNLVEATGQPILVGFMSGDAAVELEELSDEETIARAMSVLRNIYGSAIPEPEQSIITRWASDPQSYGSYSYLTTAADTSMRAELAETVEGKIFFAGEATHSEYPATVHGAYLSGEREAKKIMLRSR